MNLQRKVWYMIIGGVLTLAVAFGALGAFAQTDEGTTVTTPEATTPDTDGTEATTPTLPDGNGRAHSSTDTYLADALGITIEELDAAYQKAQEAAIAQAVTDGLLTQEEADQLLANDFGRHGHGFLGDQDTYLAAALGITVEELQAAELTAQAAKLADMVAAGTLTQEQADLMTAQQAVQNYLDQDAISQMLQEVYATAVAAAVADGVITQAQADQLLANYQSAGGFHGFGIPGMRGPHGGRHGGHGGHGTFPGSSNSNQPAITDTGSDA